MKPLFVEVRTTVARVVMRHAAAFVALVAPWLALPSDRRMSRLVMLAIIVVLALGLATSGWLAVEAIGLAAHRLYREDAP